MKPPLHMVFTQEDEVPKRLSATASWTFSDPVSFQELPLTKAQAFAPIRLSAKGLRSLASWHSRPLSEDVNSYSPSIPATGNQSDD